MSLTKVESFFERALTGRSLSSDDASTLESSLSSGVGSDAIDQRLRLLGFYSHLGRQSDFFRHICWFVQNAPDSNAIEAGLGLAVPLLPDERALYEQVSVVWLSVTDQKTMTAPALAHASKFFSMNKSFDVARRLLERAQALDPSNPLWPQRLSYLFESTMHDQPDGWRLAIDHCALAMKLHSDPFSRFDQQIRLPALFLQSGNLDLAEQKSMDLLSECNERTSDQANYVFAIHKAHVVLGLIALKRGDTDNACDHLLASAKSGSSFSMQCHGPDLRLADGLVDCGRVDVVSRFYELADDMDIDEHHKRQIQIRKDALSKN